MFSQINNPVFFLPQIVYMESKIQNERKVKRKTKVKEVSLWEFVLPRKL